MKEHALKALVVVVLIAGAFALRGREKMGAQTPEAAVSAFFDAAAKGQDEAYLAATTGAMRKSLESTRSQLGVKRFRESIKKTTQGVKAYAFIPREGAEDDVALLDVEIVFVDRKEVQRVRVRRTGSAWAIAEMSQAETVKPLIPYGTPVFPDLPAAE